MLMNSKGGPTFEGCMLINFSGGPPILRGRPPLGTISMDLAVHTYGWCIISSSELFNVKNIY